MALSEARFLSLPCPVVFAGWQTTTAALQQAGWRLSAEQDFMRYRIRLALNFEPARLFMLSESRDFDFVRSGTSYGDRNQLPVFEIVHVANGMTINLMESSFDFKPIDAAPQFTEVKRTSIEDFGIFAPCLARTEEIIVEPATVAGLLDQIKQLQAPELAAIRERNRKAERRSDQPFRQQRFHAQIVSLAA